MKLASVAITYISLGLVSSIILKEALKHPKKILSSFNQKSILSNYIPEAWSHSFETKPPPPKAEPKQPSFKNYNSEKAASLELITDVPSNKNTSPVSKSEDKIKKDASVLDPVALNSQALIKSFFKFGTGFPGALRVTSKLGSNCVGPDCSKVIVSKKGLEEKKVFPEDALAVAVKIPEPVQDPIIAPFSKSIVSFRNATVSNPKLKLSSIQFRKSLRQHKFSPKIITQTGRAKFNQMKQKISKLGSHFRTSKLH